MKPNGFPFSKKMENQLFAVVFEYSDRKDKRYVVTIVDQESGKAKTVHFGSPDHENYTIHKDHSRKVNYLKRHAPREDWTVQGIFSAGFWSRWMLWNKESIAESMADIEKRFPIRFI